MLKSIHSDEAPAALGPYSQAIIAGDFLYISGQLPIDVVSNKFAGTNIKVQTKQCLQNISAICQSANINLNQVCKVNIFLQDLKDFNDMNEIYGQFFTNHKPARCAVQVAGIPKGALIEIEAIAYLK